MTSSIFFNLIKSRIHSYTCLLPKGKSVPSFLAEIDRGLQSPPPCHVRDPIPRVRLTNFLIIMKILPTPFTNFEVEHIGTRRASFQDAVTPWNIFY